MTYFHTCKACVIDGACTYQTELKVKLAGLMIRSLKHRCTHRVDLFSPGSPVLVETYPTFDRGEDGDDEVPRCWFKGHFVRFASGKPLVFVAKGTLSEGGGWEFEPHGNGFLKLPLARVKPRDGEAVSVEACRWCAAIPTLGQQCGRDANYTPSGHCLAATLPAETDLSGPQGTEAALSAPDRPLNSSGRDQ